MIMEAEQLALWAGCFFVQVTVNSAAVMTDCGKLSATCRMSA